MSVSSEGYTPKVRVRVKDLGVRDDKGRSSLLLSLLPPFPLSSNLSVGETRSRQEGRPGHSTENRRATTAGETEDEVVGTGET